MLLCAFTFANLCAGDNVSSVPVPLKAPSAESPSTAHELLLQAIREKRVLIFTYRGHKRIVEPHAYGRSTKGEAVLHAFQFDGTSASRPPPGWRTFATSAIESPKLGEASFAQARDGYSPNELRLMPFWAEVPALVIEE
jgi:predicted DNA-binding transcriptional regulator YafY